MPSLTAIRPPIPARVRQQALRARVGHSVRSPPRHFGNLAVRCEQQHAYILRVAQLLAGTTDPVTALDTPSVSMPKAPTCRALLPQALCLSRLLCLLRPKYRGRVECPDVPSCDTIRRIHREAPL